MKQTGILPADFGTYTHRVIESRFTGIPVFLPEEIRGIAEEMAAAFLASDIGGKAQKAVWRLNEYGIITRYPHRDRMLTITGQIDLIFEYENRIYIVDYKTDRTEQPELHAEQMAVYRKAAGDLYNKPVETWLYYLRSGRTVKLG
ncbi:PD-(D/E)XK nuclease family protein [Brucepastera parasyntrophica]|uniref:PD-(D/E)XK nuclease family protein n=1 Tax=Brucepastera parasyntrophica TaxID=2880008 RepID=UPI002109033A|nr:PD-(D/E)XK nuclease family protein [Brucepastera parasyntrophica]ULQ61070.1 PD-(D/E)XK nuclease family protein [Brucepastera parasyntrophica]